MATPTGFGPKKLKEKPKQSKGAKERANAAKQYDQFKADGTPDYEIYIRIQGKKQWYPVGALAVKRSSQISRAIYNSVEQLHSGAFRLFPILRKHEGELEYGYRLKEFKDDPIQLAKPPAITGTKGMQAAIAGLKNTVGGLLKRG